MKSIEVKLLRPIRFHAMPASTISNEAKKFESDIKIVTRDREVDAKRAPSLMMLGVQSFVGVKAEGADEEAAAEAVAKAVKAASGM